MKTILKLTTALLCLQIWATSTFAQASKKTFTGIWELSRESDNGQSFQNVPHGFLKIFNTDGTFCNVQARASGAIISHGGTYRVKNQQFYTENVSHRIPEMGGGPLGKDFKN